MEDSGNEFLYTQLVKLGDMMGDGLHYEPGGKWIEKEYKNISIQLGLYKPKPKANNNIKIDEFMQTRTAIDICDSCGNALKQTRSGSLRAKCVTCGKLYQLGKVKKR